MLLPADYLQIRGLGFFGHLKFTSAQEPIWEHYHQHCMEVSVCVSGRQRFVVGKREFWIQGGDVLFNYPMEAHGSGDDPQEVSERFYFGLDLRQPQSFLEMAMPWDRYYYEKLKYWNIRQLKIAEEDIELLRQSFAHFSKLEDHRNDIESRMLGYGYFLVFINRLLRAANAEQNGNDDMKTAVSYIQSHIRDPIAIGDIAAATGMSESYLRKRFIAEIGVSPKEYINREKIELAKTVLQQEQIDSITNIAYQLGFSDSSHFSKTFRQFMNCSPRDFRRQWLRRQELGDKWAEQLNFNQSFWLK